MPAASFSKQQVTIPTVTAKQAGYIFVYLSYEDQSNNYVYFDDFKVAITPTNIVQNNEYYAHGLPTANSWTRDNAVANNFLGNGGTELNATSQLYDLDFRDFDPVLGRLNQVDPMADKYSSASSYHFSFNNPISYTDINGADPNGNPFIHPPDEPYDWFGFNSNMGRDQAYAHGGATYGGGSDAGIRMDRGNLIVDFDNIGPNGGSWTPTGGYHDFASQEEAFAAGARYMSMFNLWGTNGYAKNLGDALARFVDLQYKVKSGGATYLASNKNGMLTQDGHDHGPIDLAKAIASLYKNLVGGYGKGRCADWVINKGLVDGGGAVYDVYPSLPRYAYKFGPTLLDMGFNELGKYTQSDTSYTPMAGDVVILEPWTANKNESGHMMMFSGSVWYSDYNQGYDSNNNPVFYPWNGSIGATNLPDYTVYRYTPPK